MVKIFFAGFLANAAFAPISHWYLGVLGFALFLRTLKYSRRPIFDSFLFGFLLNAFALHWTSKYVGALPWLLLTLLQAAFYLPVGMVYRFSRKIGLAIFTILLMEQLRSIFPFSGFAWTRIGFSQADSPALSVAPYGGVLAISALTLLLALLLSRFNLKNVGLIGALMVVLLIIPKNEIDNGSLTLVGIQGSTPTVGLDFNSRAKAVFEMHRDATYKLATGEFAAVIWPENAIDIDPAYFPEVQQDIADLTASLGTPLIAGVLLAGSSGPENASISYNARGEVLSTYIKRSLTPFGEYIPLRSLAEFISPLAKRVRDFSLGDALVTHKIGEVRVGPIICYEIIDDALVSEMAQASQALIVQTNNATFAGTAQSRQQLAITRIRAAEQRRAILTVSTIGISAVIDQQGRVLAETDVGVQDVIFGDLKLNNQDTFFSTWRPWIEPSIFLFILILCLLTDRKRWRR